MKNKPKFFIFQACRGNQIDKGTSEKDGVLNCFSQQNEIEEHLPRKSSWGDMLILCSTIPKYYSYRNTVYGSYLVQCLCKVFKEYSHELDLENMLKKISIEMQRSFKQNLQMPEYWNRGFNKKLFFNYGVEDYSHLFNT